MNITDYLDNLPTHRSENYLYTDAREAFATVEEVVNASIDATGIGGSIVGSVLQANEGATTISNIAQELIDLNSAAVSDILRIEFNDQNLKPVELILSSEGGCRTLAQSRIDIVVANDSDGQLVIRTNKLHSAANCVINISVENNAKLDVVFVQTEKNEAPIFVNTLVNVAQNANLCIATVNTDATFVRNNLQINLNGEHSNARIYGVGKANNNGHIDNTTWVNHHVPNCTSEELYKCIVADEAIGAFAGRIVVAPNAQKTSAQQTCRNMLLSANAHAYAKPQLEIYADDVKCSHGATSGQIDAAQLFYMQQRGIDRQTAMHLLTNAFALEVISKIPIQSVRAELIVEE